MTNGKFQEVTNMVREVREDELNELLNLYLYLHEKSVPEMSECLKSTWKTIIQDKNHHIIVKVVDDVAYRLK